LPELRTIQMIEARLTNGTTRILSIPPPPSFARFGQTTRTGLPPLPPGVAYVEGPVRGYAFVTPPPESGE
jgi:hypothetical protein